MRSHDSDTETKARRQSVKLERRADDVKRAEVQAPEPELVPEPQQGGMSPEEMEKMFADLKEQERLHPVDSDYNIWNHAFQAWAELKPKEIERRQWLYGRHYLRGATSATIAPGGTGKSILALTEAIAIITGRPLLGITPMANPWNPWPEVFYFSAEESLIELHRRVIAICQHFKIPLAQLEDHLIVVSGHDFPLVIGTPNGKGVNINEELMYWLEGFHGAAMIFDPFISVHQCPENDNSALDAIVKRLGRLATNRPIKAVEIVHHSRKTSGPITGEDARGASALFDGVRALRTLNRMTEAEGQRLKVNYRDFFRINSWKTSYSRLSAEETQWYRHHPVIIPNGEDVGVPVPWQAPGPTDDVTAAQLKQITSLVRDGQYRVDPRADNWIGGAVADALGLDIEDETDREQIKLILSEWFKSGVLQKADRRLSGDRHLRTIVEVGQPTSKPART